MRSSPLVRSASAPRKLTALAIGGALVLTGVPSLVSLPIGLASAQPAEIVEEGFATTGNGPYSGVVPDGVCAAVITAQGGAGGNALGGDDVDDDDDPPDEPAEPINATDLGRGALLTATYSVVPGQPFRGHVGGGGAGAAWGGTNGANTDGATGNGDGGNGGTGGHRGAGGGALTTVIVGGLELIVAGGGGGGGGGHNAEYGAGGNAGVPSTPGDAAPGADGAPGWDAAGGGPFEPGGGLGGGEAAPGDGGIHPENPNLNGFAGNVRDGGDGGPDPSFDSGGGGGAGYFGGGGGASTITAGVPNGGAGGGGGSSYVHPTSPTADAAPARDYEGLLGPAADPTLISGGPDGFVTIDWVPCMYDLEVKKSVKKVKYGKKGTPGRDNTVRVGDRIEWRVVITNHGPDAMTRGDVVDLVDSRAGEANLRIREIRTAGGQSTTSVTNGAVTCDAAVGQLLPETLLCARPFGVQPASLLDGEAQPGGERGLNRGERLIIVYRERVLEATQLTNTATVTDRADGAERADSDTAGIRVRKGNPRMRLVKTASPQRIAKVGQRVRYEYRVTNTGKVALSDIRIEERRFTGSGKVPTPRCPAKPKQLKPGKSVTCTATYRATRKDVKAGRIVNRAVAHGVSPDGSAIRSNADRAVVLGPLPAPPITGARTAV